MSQTVGISNEARILTFYNTIVGGRFGSLNTRLMARIHVGVQIRLLEPNPTVTILSFEYKAFNFKYWFHLSCYPNA